MPITHEWNGTVLTITSDSGTSSCDLKGAKGDDGPRGVAGAAGGTCYNVSYAPANLLDNSYFLNPINQRGITSRVGGGYGIDRWRADGSGTITVGSNGITLANVLSFRQPVSLKAGTYTLAFHLTNGTTVRTCFHFDGADTYTSIDNTGHGTSGAYINCYKQSTGVLVVQFVLSDGYEYTLDWAALYEGEYTADTLPAYHYKGYAAELMECMRYYRAMSRVYGVDAGSVNREMLILSPRMRIIPTVSTISEWAGVEGAGYTVMSVDVNTLDLSYTGWGTVRLALSADL